MTVGAALSGLRPVVEVMYIDFITLAMDQLVNHAAKLRYMTDGLLQVPLVVRAQGGARGSMGAHHSQSLEAWFGHVPGLKVLQPSTPEDAKGLLKSAIRSNDPVLFIEHATMYQVRGEVPEGDALDFGRALGRDRKLLGEPPVTRFCLIRDWKECDELERHPVERRVGRVDVPDRFVAHRSATALAISLLFCLRKATHTETCGI